MVVDLEDHDGMIRTTNPRGRPKRRHSEGIGNHSSKRPRTASVEVTLPADTTSYSLPSTSSSIMSEVVNVILAQVASQQRQQQQSQVLSDEVQENVEVMSAPPHSNELIIIENSLDSTNTVEVWAGGEGGGANMTGEVNQILQRIGVEHSGETIQDPERNVIVTEATAEEVVSQEIITVETPCDDEAITTVTSHDNEAVTTVIPCHDEAVTINTPAANYNVHDEVTTGHEGTTVSEPPPNNDVITTSEQVLATNGSNEVDKSMTFHDNATTDDVTLHHGDNTTANNDV